MAVPNKSSVGSAMASSRSLLNRLDAYRTLLEVVTKADVASLRIHCEEESDVVGAIFGILYDAEVDDPEGLLEDCDIFQESDDGEEDSAEERLGQ